MPIVAIFESDIDLDPVIEKLPSYIAQNDFDLLEPGLPTTENRENPVAVPGNQGGAGVVPSLTLGSSDEPSLSAYRDVLDRLGVPHREQDFFAQSLKDGGRMMVIDQEKDDVPAVMDLLKEHGATRIV